MDTTQQKQLAAMPSFKMRNGVTIPALGLGCAFGSWSNGEAYSFNGFTPELGWPSIKTAIDAGYRHFDGAYVYGTHHILRSLLGQSYAERQCRREEIFITTKVAHPPVEIALNNIGKSLDMESIANIYERIIFDFEKSLDELGHGYVDLLLVHWPGNWINTDRERGKRYRMECWRALEAIHQNGQARAIGVSNFMVPHLQDLIDTCTIVPHFNQIEISPYIYRKDCLDFCRQHEIQLGAWAPFGSGTTGVLQDQTIAKIAQKYGKDLGQIILRWLFEQDIVSLPKSLNPKRIASNLDIFDFTLSEDDHKELSGLHRDISSVGRRPEDIV